LLLPRLSASTWPPETHYSPPCRPRTRTALFAALPQAPRPAPPSRQNRSTRHNRATDHRLTTALARLGRAALRGGAPAPRATALPVGDPDHATESRVVRPGAMRTRPRLQLRRHRRAQHLQRDVRRDRNVYGAASGATLRGRRGRSSPWGPGRPGLPQPRGA